MIGRTPSNIQAIRPLKDGVIADFEICEMMLRYFIRRVHPHRFSKPRMVICVPSGITGVEKRAVQEAAEYAGARKAYIIEEPMAAAIGAGLPIHEPTGNMVVDIGGGTTEVAVISLGGIVVSQSIRIGGDELDEAIISFVKKEYSLALGERTAEEIKIALGSAYELEEELHAEIRGRDLVTGLPKTVVTTTEEIRKAIEEPVSAIVDAVKVTLDRTPPELAADIMEQGIVLTGGGALLHGLDSGCSPRRTCPSSSLPTRSTVSPSAVACASRSSRRSSRSSSPRPTADLRGRGGRLAPQHQPAPHAGDPAPRLDHGDHRRSTRARRDTCHRPRSETGPRTSSRRVQRGIAAVCTRSGNFFAGMVDYGGALGENQRLQLEVGQLRRQLLESEQAQAQLDQIRAEQNLPFADGIPEVLGAGDLLALVQLRRDGRDRPRHLRRGRGRDAGRLRGRARRLWSSPPAAHRCRPARNRPALRGRGPFRGRQRGPRPGPGRGRALAAAGRLRDGRHPPRCPS